MNFELSELKSTKFEHDKQLTKVCESILVDKLKMKNGCNQIYES